MEEATRKLLDFRRRISEAAVWCMPRADPTTVGDALWTPALRPAHWPERPTYTALQAAYKLSVGQRGPDLEGDPWLGATPATRRGALVDAVVATRSRLLVETGHQPVPPATDLQGGRLLIFDPDDTLADGAAEQETGGFYDVESTPAWDTWLAYVNEPAPPIRGSAQHRGYLVAWVPPALLTIADDGVLVDPAGCIRWARNVDAPFLRQLREAGLLPR